MGRSDYNDALPKTAANFQPLTPLVFLRTFGAHVSRPDRHCPRPAAHHLRGVLRPLPKARLRACRAWRRRRRHRLRHACQYAADARGALRSADARSGAAGHQHSPRRCGDRIPARPFRIESGDRRPRILRRHGGGAEANCRQAARHRLRRSRISVRRACREGAATGEPRLRSVPCRRRSRIFLAYAGRRMGRDQPQLHVRHHRRSERRRLPPPRRGAHVLRQRACRRDGTADRLSVDTADVPLQRLVLPLVDLGRCRNACVPALGACKGDLRCDRRVWRHPPLRRADRYGDADQCHGCREACRSRRRSSS